MSASKPCVIVGKGRIGQALVEMGPGGDVLVGREGGIPATPEGPIVVCTRNDVLDEVVKRTPESRRKDLLFVQNGMLQPWMDANGLGSNTQALIFFAVSKLGEKPKDGKTDLNPEGLTAVTGPHAQAFADRLAAGGLSCKVLSEIDYKKAMLEKLVWISAIMLVGAEHQCLVGDVESKHTEQVSGLFAELAEGGAAELGVTLDDGTVARLLAYSRSVAHFPTAVKEFEWRNGWFWKISEREMAAGNADPFPTHSKMLKAQGVI